MSDRIASVTLTLCTRNGGERLKTCLDHIEALDADPLMEVMLVDNGSDDGVSFGILESFAARTRFDARVLVTETPGNSAGRNLAVAKSSGELLIFIDDDCYADPALVSEWIKAFETRDIGFASGMVKRYDMRYSDIGCVEHPDERRLEARSFIWRGFIQGSNMAFRRQTLIDAGGFDARLGAGTPYAGEEWDLALRSSRAGWAAAYIPSAIVWHDHRRTDADALVRMKYYDFGGGVVYAKNTVTRSAYQTAKEIRRELIRLRRDDPRRIRTFFHGYATYFLLLAGRSSQRRGPAR